MVLFKTQGSSRLVSSVCASSRKELEILPPRLLATGRCITGDLPLSLSFTRSTTSGAQMIRYRPLLILSLLLRLPFPFGLREKVASITGTLQLTCPAGVSSRKQDVFGASPRRPRNKLALRSCQLSPHQSYRSHELYTWEMQWLRFTMTSNGPWQEPSTNASPSPNLTLRRPV